MASACLVDHEVVFQFGAKRLELVQVLGDVPDKPWMYFFRKFFQYKMEIYLLKIKQGGLMKKMDLFGHKD